MDFLEVIIATSVGTITTALVYEYGKVHDLRDALERRNAANAECADENADLRDANAKLVLKNRELSELVTTLQPPEPDRQPARVKGRFAKKPA